MRIKFFNQSFIFVKTVFLTLTVCSTILANDVYQAINDIEYDEVISLGHWCEVSFQLRINNKRSAAYPFDWVLSPTKGLISFVENKGANFLDFNKLAYIKPWGTNAEMLDLVYGFSLLHDFELNINYENYKSVKERYRKRTKRFFDHFLSDRKILFIRLGITKEEAILLDHIIHTNYPNFTYKIAAINNDPSQAEDWGLERVKNYYFVGNIYQWGGDYDEWSIFLNSIRVNPLKNEVLADYDFRTIPVDEDIGYELFREGCMTIGG